MNGDPGKPPSAADKIRARAEATAAAAAEEKRSVAEKVRADADAREAAAKEQQEQETAAQIARQRSVDEQYERLQEEVASLQSKGVLMSKDIDVLKEKRKKVKASVREAVAEVRKFAETNPKQADEFVEENLGKKKRKGTFEVELAESASIRAEVVPKRAEKKELNAQIAALQQEARELFPKTTKGKEARDKEILDTLRRNLPPNKELFGMYRAKKLLVTSLYQERGTGSLFQHGLDGQWVEHIDNAAKEPGTAKRALVSGVFKQQIPMIRATPNAERVEYMTQLKEYSEEKLRPVVEARFDLEYAFARIKEGLGQYRNFLQKVESPEDGVGAFDEAVKGLRNSQFFLSGFKSGSRRSEGDLNLLRETRIPISKISSGLYPDFSELEKRKGDLQKEVDELSPKIEAKRKEIETKRREKPWTEKGRSQRDEAVRMLEGQLQQLESSRSTKNTEMGTISRQLMDLPTLGRKVAEAARSLGIFEYLRGAEYVSLSDALNDIDAAIDKRVEAIGDEIKSIELKKEELVKNIEAFKKVQQATIKDVGSRVAKSLGAEGY